jgi:cyclopropane-fatty-acyl-phospholipid synthase
MADQRGCTLEMWNISREQIRLAKKRCAGSAVTIHEADYRQATGRFDRLVAVGFFEHVGPKNYRQFFETVDRLLAPNGLFLLQTIGTTVRGFQTEAWLNANIFPNSALPTLPRLAEAIESLFVIEDWHNLQLDYANTLRAWRQNFRENWPELRRLFPEKYDRRFKRRWDFYLDFCIAAFTSRVLNISQYVFSKHGVSGGYRLVR